VESNAYLGSLESEGSLEQTARHLEGPKKVAGGDQGQRNRRALRRKMLFVELTLKKG